jgi:hypothetical protein
LVQTVLARTKIAIFGPGQFILSLAKTEIAIFGPGENGWVMAGRQTGAQGKDNCENFRNFVGI